jgi:hypothetical protein
MRVAISNFKENFLLISTILGFVADIISLISFFAGETGLTIPLIIASVTSVLLVVLLFDFQANRDTYPLLQNLLQTLLKNKMLFSLVALVLSSAVGALCGGMLGAIYISISKPDVQDPVNREMTAMLVISFLVGGAFLGFLMAFLAFFYASLASLSWSLGELVPRFLGGRASQSPVTTHTRKGIVLKEIKKPITEVTHEGFKVRVEFIVENWGEATKIYPYVEYKVAEYKGGKYEERVVKSPTSWEVDLQAQSTTPIAFDAIFDATTMLLTKPPNKVKVKLYRKPRGR